MIKNSQNRPESSGFGAKTVQKKSIISLKKVRKRSNIGQRKGTKNARKESKKFPKKVFENLRRGSRKGQKRLNGEGKVA